jgi:hypothetical protein
MPRVRWTTEEEIRLRNLIAGGKSWTLISGTLKRSMKSVKLHAKTLRRAGGEKGKYTGRSFARGDNNKRDEGIERQ